MESNSTEIEVELLAKDYWQVYLDYYFSFSSIFFLFLGFAVYGLFIVFLLLGEDTEISHLMEIFIAAFLFVLLFAFAMSYFAVANGKRLNEGKCKYIFSVERIEVANKSFVSRIEWTYILFAKETKNYFVISMRNGQNDFIPKRSFSDFEQINNFKNLIGIKLGGSAVLKNSKEKLGLK